MPLFHETQRIRQWWLVLLILVVAAIPWDIFIRQIVRGNSVGNNPAPDWAVWLLWALIGIGLPAALFFWIRMETVVYPDRVELRFRPFVYRVIPISHIANVDANSYRPLREFGGWGIRGLGRNRACTVSGNQGVRLTLRNGNRVLIGSNRSKELAQVIDNIHSTV